MRIQHRTFMVFLLAVCMCFEQASGQHAPMITSDELAVVQAAEEKRIALINKLQPTVVAVYGKDRQGSGSAVVVTPDGLALTNYHVVQPTGGSGWAGLSDGKLYPWKVVGQDPGGDVALIQLSGKSTFTYAKLGDSRKARVGQWVMAMGNPFMLADDHTPTVTLGIVSAVHRFQPGAGGNMLVYGDCIQIDSSINPGNSGGPLFDMQGTLLGINGRGSFEERGRVNVGVGYAITIEQIRNFYADLLATKICQHATLDMTFFTREDGVICDAIDYGQNPPLARAGMMPGDRLLSFDGHPIHHANDLLNRLSVLPAGWPVEVEFISGDQRRTVTITPAALPYITPKPRNKPKEKKPRFPWWPTQLRKPPQKPGEITDRAMNRRNAQQILRQLKPVDHGKADAATKAFLSAYDPSRTLMFNKLILEGGERLWGHRAYRISAATSEGKNFRIWISVFDKSGLQLESHLMKVEVLAP